MMLNTIAGTIERRLLINYRVDPEVMARIVPPPFQPAQVDGHAIAGICLIQLSIRTGWLPRRASLRSLNGAHRVAIVLPDGTDAVYIPRRDTDSRLNTLVGGRLVPGEHHLATFDVSDNDDRRISIGMKSLDNSTRVRVVATETDRLPGTSVFSSVDHASRFFETGSIGFSDTRGADCYDCLELQAHSWSVTPLDVEHVESTFFDDRTVFPAGSAEFDHALSMRDIDHTWHSRPPLPVPASALPAR